MSCEVHVVPCNGVTPLRWQVAQGGRNVAWCVRKSDAVRVATALATVARTSVRIHGRDGRILEERSHGNETRRRG